MKKTLAVSSNYVSLGKTASKLFFVINEFVTLNNMYHFSLGSCISLFEKCIEVFLSKRQSVNDSLAEKLQTISEKHKFETFKFTCLGLFDQDKILLSLQMAIRLC